MIIKYGMQWPEGVGDLDIELWCYAHDTRAEGQDGRLTRWEHFWNAVDLLWNTPESTRRVIPNLWTERMLKGMIYNRYTCLAGAGSCVSGDTRILTDKGEIPIRDLAEAGKPVVVQTINGPELAEAPYLKGKATLYKITLSNGSSFTCTAGHRLLAPSGWTHASATNVGDLLYGYSPSLPLTTADGDLSAHPSDATRSPDTPEGCRDDCSTCSRLYGEPLLQAQESARVDAPPPSDAQERSWCTSALAGGPVPESTHTHFCPPCDPSNLDGDHPSVLSSACEPPLLSEENSTPPPFSSPRSCRPQTTRLLQQSSEVPALDSCHTPHMGCGDGRVVESQSPPDAGHIALSPKTPRLDPRQGACSSIPDKCGQSGHRVPDCVSCACVSSYGLKVQELRVVSIQNAGEDDFYDIEVPGEGHYFAEGAIHHNSGKSDAAAVFCLVEWLSRPTETLCLIMSTTIVGAKKRVWKSVNELWNSLEHQWKLKGMSAPGKMVDSRNMLIGLDITGKWSEGVGLCLVAADKDNEKEAAKKLKGLKAPAEGKGHLIAVADEATDLGDSVRVAMVGNLNTNPNFKGVFMGNPGTKLNPFGRVCLPDLPNGWNALSLGMEEWPTSLGICLSFDAHNSPRLTEPDGDSKYPWMPSRQAIAQMAREFGEDSMEYWAQVRGMFCPTGMERTVWSELELLNAQDPVRADEWDRPPDKFVAALDPAFVTEGDRSPIMWGECGTIKQKKVLNVLGFKIVQEAAGTVLSDDGEEAPITVSENVINQFREHCRFHNTPPKHAGFDGTGGGVSFGQWLHTKWSHAVHAIRFNEKPVDRRPDSTNEFTVYRNRVTQLWVQPKALVREGQIRGIPLEVIEELCLRKWAPNHTANTSCVESKRDMKKRIGRSPDLADTFVILVEVCILNGLLDVQEIRKDDRRLNQQWKKLVNVQMGFGTPGRKSLVAMPSVKRLKFSRRR